MRCFFIILLFLVSVKYGLTQNVKPYLINVGTLSPDAASIEKFGNIPVGNNTGIPNISIPIFEINTGKIKLPISINYHSGGIKVDEISSSIGLGWALNCGGTINRNLVGQPDEASAGFLSSSVPDPNLLIQSPSNYPEYIYGVAEGTTDPAPDIFSYNIGGVSGKFMMKKGGGFLQIPITNNRIESYFNGSGKMLFKITDDSGIEYQFEKIETYTPGEVNSSQVVPAFTNVWHLTKIVDANTQDVVEFNYENACNTYAFETVKNFSHTLGTYPTLSCETYYGGVVACFPGMGERNEISSTTQINSYTPVYLSSVVWKNGKITFTNNCDRLDRASEKRISEINIYSANNGIFTLIRRLKPFHSYFYYNSASASPFFYTNSDERNYRLRLDSFAIYSTNINDAAQLYRMTYDNTPMASRGTYAQDHYGFNNGQGGNTNLLENQLVSKGINSMGIDPGVYVNIGDANRNPNESYMKSCVLTSLEYPTGGKTEFGFEPHQYLTGKNVFVPGSAGAAAYAGFQQSTNYRFVWSGPRVNSRYTIFISKYSTAPGVTDYPRVILMDETTGQEVLRVTNTTPSSDVSISNNAINLIAGHSYLMTANIYTTSYSDLKAEFTIFWEEETNVEEVQNAGGLRIKTLINYSSDNKVARKEVYNYGISENGLGTSLTPYTYFSRHKRNIIYRTRSSCISCGSKIGYPTVVYSSGSLHPASQFAGSPVLYPMVTRYSVDPVSNMPNGKSEYHYGIYVDNQLVAAPDFTNENMSELFPNDWKNGFLTEENIYKFENSSYSKIENKTYQYSEHRQTSINILKAVPKYSDLSLVPSYNVTGDFDLALYQVKTGAYLLDAVISTSYEGAHELSSTENYDYTNTAHLYPTAKRTVNSKGETILENLFYPSNFSSPGNVYEKMVNRNMKSVLVSKQQLINGVQQTSSTTNYFDWFNNSGLLLPQTIVEQVKQYATEIKALFNKFDIYGNILEQRKADDIFNSYIWGYNSTYLIAQGINTPVKDIFHTSFEDLEGNSLDGDAKTGRKSKTNGYQKSLSNLTNGSYVLSYWKKSGNTWNLQKSVVTVSTNIYDINISINDQIDEVRFYPATAQMTTYTYEPLIGMTSQTDVNNRTLYYEYDGFGRLKYVKDHDGNVLKVMDYKYQEAQP